MGTNIPHLLIPRAGAPFPRAGIYVVPGVGVNSGHESLHTVTSPA